MRYRAFVSLLVLVVASLITTSVKAQAATVVFVDLNTILTNFPQPGSILVVTGRPMSPITTAGCGSAGPSEYVVNQVVLVQRGPGGATVLQAASPTGLAPGTRLTDLQVTGPLCTAGGGLLIGVTGDPD